MFKKLQNGVKKSEGFTLIELLVVIVILGILATIVTVNISGARGLALKKACKESANTLALAVEEYYVDNGVYPENSTGADTWFTTKASANAGATSLDSYLKSLPKMRGSTATADYYLEYIKNDTSFDVTGYKKTSGTDVWPGCEAVNN